MLWVFLFLFGIAIGSFLNVVALRYDGEHFLLDPKVIGGRSHCPHCNKTLTCKELIPLVSFVIQNGKCRNCKAPISVQYPFVEFLSGLIFVFVPLYFSSQLATGNWQLAILWIFVFEIFLLIAYIDILLGIIPDELNIALLILGLIELFLATSYQLPVISFLGPYASIFGLQGNIWINHIVGALVGVAIFGGLVALTRGRGMGMGDAKLALPLGFLFGWPDILFVAMLSFVIGAIFGIAAIGTGKKTMKSAIPFGPFIILSATIIFFFGANIFNWYFHLIGM